MEKRIQVIDRAVVILRAIADEGSPMRLRDVVAATGLSTTTVHRILGSLVDNGICEQEEGAYRLGLGMFELGARAQTGLDVRERGRPELERLSRETHLTSFLCVRREERGICLERVDGRYAFSLALTVGGSLPLHAGAAPRALLAYDSEDEIAAYLDAAAPLKRFTERTLTSKRDVMKDLRESRARGWVLSDEDVTPGVAALGAPVFSHADSERPLAAISVAGLKPQVLGDGRDQIVAALVDAANRISEGLGARLASSTSNSASTRAGGPPTEAA
jgi:DNA-binding IclR family transcriptional regulator